MSKSLQDAQSEWLAQVASMRAAIEELKLNQSENSQHSYRPDIVLDDDDFSGDSGRDEIWDITGEEANDEDSSDTLDTQEGAYLNGDSTTPGHGVGWLRIKTTTFAKDRSGLNADELQEQILVLLGSDMKGTIIIAYLWLDTHHLFRR